MTNSEVIESWLDGESGKSGTGNLHTDGVKLYSYNLMIGSRETNQTRIWDYTATGKFVSQTTSRHVGLAMRKSVVFFLMETNA